MKRQIHTYIALISLETFGKGRAHPKQKEKRRMYVVMVLNVSVTFKADQSGFLNYLGEGGALDVQHHSVTSCTLFSQPLFRASQEGSL